MSEPTREDYKRDIRTIILFGITVTIWMLVMEGFQLAGVALVRHGHIGWSIPCLVVSYLMLFAMLGWCVWAIWKMTRGRTNVPNR